MPSKVFSFPSSQRLKRRGDIEALLKGGRWAVEGPVRYCFIREASSGGEGARLLVTAPKKLFRRAVKRNLLKRRLREAYRLEKAGRKLEKVDLLLAYNSKEIVDFQAIRLSVAAILERIENEGKL